jgi:cysteinyl-tRNA synthetase
MSKSLKNFITIKEFLQSHTPNQFRIFCLVNKYHNDLEYTEDRMTDAIHIEKRFLDFIATISTFNETDYARKKWTQQELQLFSKCV